MTPSPRIVRAAGSGALAVLGAVAAIMAVGYGVTQDNGQIGAGFLPLVLGLVVALLGAIDAGAILLRREPSHPAEQLTGVEAEADAAAIDTPEEASDLDVLGRTQRQRNRMLLIVIGMILGALLLVPLTGLLIALALLVVAIATLVERRKLVPSLLVGGIAIAVVHVVFAVLLKVPMPTGLIGLI